jgi:hypothetical protein
MQARKRQHRALEFASFGFLLHRQESPYSSPPVTSEEVETSMYFGGLFFFIFIHPVRSECNWPCILLGVETKISE